MRRNILINIDLTQCRLRFWLFQASHTSTRYLGKSAAYEYDEWAGPYVAWRGGARKQNGNGHCCKFFGE